MANSDAPLLEVDGGEAAPQLVVEQPDHLDVERDLGAAAQRVADQSDQALGRDRGQPEHDHLGEAAWPR